MSLDGGSASPPTADVPTNDPPITCSEPGCHRPATDRCAGPTGAGCEQPYCGEHIYPAGDDGLLCSTDYDAIEHRDLEAEEGVAGEPEATTKVAGSRTEAVREAKRHLFARLIASAHLLDQPFSNAPDQSPWTRIKTDMNALSMALDALSAAESVTPTPTHAPTPETPGAANVAGGVTVPDEAVEAYRAGYGRSFRKENRTDRDDVRAGLTAAAPLIVEHYLRSRIKAAEVDQTPEAVWEQVREMARHVALRTAAVDALRAVAGEIRRELVCCDVYDRARGDAVAVKRVERDGHAICFWSEAAARINEGRADELERGGDHVDR